MAKKPRLTLVDSTGNADAPPTTLNKAGSKLWQSIMSEYRIDDSGGRAMLLQICTAADRAADCAEAIERDGPMIRTKNGPREHPLLKAEIASRSFIVRSLHRLGLDIEPPRNTTGRPSGTFNPTKAS